MQFLSDDNQPEASSKVLKRSLLLLGIWMTYLTLTITSLIAWSIIFSLQNVNLVRSMSQIPRPHF